jgi:ElaB/YqjD/DUF883 family membrane-anchored ribosome-binding protein
MKKHTQAIVNDMGTLVEDARGLMAATADVAGERVSEARERLATALDSASEVAGRVRDRTVEGAQAADRTVRENAYKAIGITFGLGALLGYLVAHRCSRSDE